MTTYGPKSAGQKVMRVRKTHPKTSSIGKARGRRPTPPYGNCWTTKGSTPTAPAPRSNEAATVIVHPLR